MQYKVLPFIDPSLLYRLTAQQRGTIFLDSSMFHSHYGRYSYLLINPVTILSSKADSFKQEALELESILNINKIDYDSTLPPFIGGLAGFFSYDLGRQFEHITRYNQNIVPDFILGLYNQVFAFDHIKKESFLIVTEVQGYQCNLEIMLDTLYKLYEEATQLNSNNEIKLPSLVLTSNYSQDSYMEMVDTAREYILNGDIFEVNCAQKYTSQLPFNYPLDSLYAKLRKSNPAPFSAYLNFDQIQILSFSPERFINITDKQVETRPIKGTIKRSLNKNEDENLKQQLMMSDKNRAENIMIVDLMRNDLTKICHPKSINVSQLCAIESYSNVHHLVSVVNGVLQDDISLYDFFRAVFPGGSITGAPKIRAMQIIEELEPVARGVYCGSIGYISFNHCIDLSIAIRTLIVQDNELSLSVGGAVTADSDSFEEYLESQVKGQKMMETLAN